MQALDSFVSPIPGFEGDIPILTILVSAKPPNGEVDSDSSTGVSADTSRTRAGKRKATANLTPQTKANKAMWKSSGGNQNQQTCTHSTYSNSSIGSSKRDPDSLIEQVHLSWIIFFTDFLVTCEPLIQNTSRNQLSLLHKEYSSWQ
jgi:hypothetical protein